MLLLKFKSEMLLILATLLNPWLVIITIFDIPVGTTLNGRLISWNINDRPMIPQKAVDVNGGNDKSFSVNFKIMDLVQCLSIRH